MNKLSTLNGLLQLRQLHKRISATEAELIMLRQQQQMLQLGVYANCEHQFAKLKGYEHEGENCEVCGVSNFMVSAHEQAWNNLKLKSPESYRTVEELLQTRLNSEQN